MPKLVPIDVSHPRRRHRRGISATSDTGEWIEVCISVAKRPAFSDDTRKRKLSTPEALPVPELSDEILMEILARLPIKYLVRCRSVCKAWRTIVSDPLFVRMHLRRSASRWEQEPSFIITPLTLDRVIPLEVHRPMNFSKHIRFYQWQQSACSGGRAARFLHSKKFGSREFKELFHFAHCDGLVLAPTDTKLYLFNPATRDSITLPDSDRNKRQYAITACHCVGLGLDPRTGKYKVVQAFYRTFPAGFHTMGMEVFTVNGDEDEDEDEDGGVWRETMDDPPYPVQRWELGQTVKGFMFWRIDRARHYKPAPRGLLRLNLANEEFGVTGLPDSLDPALDHSFILDAMHLHGREELWLTACTSHVSVTIWTMPVDVDGGQGHWEPRYSIPVPYRTYPVALVAGSRILLRSHYTLSSYDLATSEVTTVCEMDRMRYQGRRGQKWKNLWGFTVLPYTESLIQITSA